jgi:hypothetical protein
MPKKSKLNALENKQAIIQMLATGVSQADVAHNLNVSESQISRFSNREDIKKLIENEAYRMMDCLPDAVENIKALVWGMKHLPPNDHKNRDLCYRNTHTQHLELYTAIYTLVIHL